MNGTYAIAGAILIGSTLITQRENRGFGNLLTDIIGFALIAISFFI
jgi:hypothetical protein